MKVCLCVGPQRFITLKCHIAPQYIPGQRLTNYLSNLSIQTLKKKLDF